jgi:hypothetical protein
MRLARISAMLVPAGLVLPFCPAQARDPLVQEPSSAWQMDYGDDRCTLARSFGEGEDQTLFTLSMYAPDDFPTINIIRKERPRDPNKYLVQFAPDTEYAEIDYPMQAKFGDLNGVILPFSLRPVAETIAIEKQAKAKPDERDYTVFRNWTAAEREERERSITEFRLRRAFADDLHLKLGSMRQPMEAMRTCLDELLGHWGIDAEVQRSLRQPALPVGNPGDWVVTADYPQGMLTSGYQGVVDFRLIVGADGKPTNCIIQQTSRPADFAAASCRALMRRAKFSPAIDAAGNPVISYWSNSVRFVIP